MSFTEKQIKALESPLSSAAVKHRKQGGRQVAYIEGWHAIAEANRIFGFGAWSRETTEIRCVSEKSRTVGEHKDAGWGVSYIAKVRVTVGNLVREGCGTGHGIDKDLGQAHESAIKEAETDAMKRALMTFGNPFGLALYDKAQANVADPIDESTIAFIQLVEAAINTATDPAALHQWWMSEDQKKARRAHGLEPNEVDRLKSLVLSKIETLKTKAAA